MMAAYQPQPGTMHPGMAPHGHPAMAGQPITAAQMQQIAHPGPVTPGPHVTQPGAMMGMQPGANAMGGPVAMAGQHPGAQMAGMPAQMGGQTMAGGAQNAHAIAMNQMNPQAVLQQQQMMQQQLQNNPNFAMQQQALMTRRMAQLQAGGMAGMHQGNMQGLNAQQMQQLAQGGQGMPPQGVQLPQHLQLQQMQVRMQQQQQAAQAHQNQQQMQHQLAMQQAGSQQSNQGAQQAVQNQQGGQQQHPGPPMRPQSRPNPNEQSQSGPQPPTPAQQTPQQGQTQQPQQAQQAQNNPQQGQQPPQQQQPQPQPQQPQQQGQPQQAMTPQQMALIQRQRQMQAQQQNVALQRQMAQAQQAQSQGGGGVFILKVIQFGDHLSSFDGDSGKDIGQWHNFVDRHFAPEARFIHTFAPLPGPGLEDKRPKRYEVPRATIARYFQTYFDSNAAFIRLHLEGVRETPMQPNRHQVSFSNAIFTVAYPNGARLEMNGMVNVLFAPGSDFIELMEFYTASTEEHVTRSEIEKLISSWSPTMANKASPKMAKNKLPKAQQKLQSQLDGLTIDHFPRVSKGKLGITERVQQFLEIDETMCVMADLISFAQERKVRPEQALEGLVAQYQEQGGPNVLQHGNPQINLPPNGVPMGNRTPSMQHMQMPNVAGGQFSSPSVSNLNLPMQNGIAGMNGSPSLAHNQGLAPNMNMANSHTPSPHQSNMSAPAMMPQHSQQGTNSSAASANTSPNVNNKRRRSTVKMEGEDGSGADGGQGAGGRVKPSPRMPKKSKPGA